jgi:dihydrofolate synthase/folylpolyglutamate synthase
LAALYARTAGGVRLGLERTGALLAKAGNPQLSFRSYHVAGTNGKGSVVATLAAVLRANGMRVGVYTSPHLVDFRERIVVDDEPIPEDRVIEFAERWLPMCDRIGATFFEATTALAFSHFADSGVDIAVVETGLGGRLDSTNVLMPSVATVTSVALDHTDLLGGSLEQVAAEKAGIFKAGIPAVIGERNVVLSELLAKHARDAGASAVHQVVPDWSVEDVAISLSGTCFSVACADPETRGRFRTPLVGVHQAFNTATAFAALHAAQELPDIAEIASALESVRLAGRFQIHDQYVFDVAHNPSAAVALAETLSTVALPRPVSAVVAVLGDKDWRGVIGALSRAVDRFICTIAPSAPVERLWNPEAAATFAHGIGAEAEAIADFDAALAAAKLQSGTVLITGSFHTVGDAMSRLQVNPLAA